MARLSRSLAVAAAGLAAMLGAALPAAAAQASTADYTPSSAEWWMTNWHVPTEVWPLSEGAGVTVGVLDTGVQASVPDLSGVVLTGGDMLGSGNGDTDSLASQDGHGTPVAALIAGQGIDGGPVGIAPKSKILPVQVDSGTVTDSSSSDVANGIKYAVDHGASVINLSVGIPTSSATSCDPQLQQSVAYALAHNVVVVASSGDTNLTGTSPIEPASCAGVLAVGGVESTGSLWSNSTQEPYVSVAAPADRIMVQGMDGRTSTVGSGTSYSSPLVAGAAALIRSRYPSMLWYQVDQRIIGTALGVQPVPNNGYGYGVMDVNRALDVSAYPVSASSPNPPLTTYDAWLKTSDGQAWAQANNVTVPSTGSSSAAGNPGSTAGAAPSATAKSSSGGSATTIIIIVVVVIVVLAGVALALFQRSRSTRGRNFGV